MYQRGERCWPGMERCWGLRCPPWCPSGSLSDSTSRPAAFSSNCLQDQPLACTKLYYYGKTFLCTATKIPLMYSFSGNSAASAPISTFMCLWAIYIVPPGSVYMFPPAEWADRLWEYINHSQTHECGNWNWDPDIPFLGIFVSKFRYFVFAVWSVVTWGYLRLKMKWYIRICDG